MIYTQLDLRKDKKWVKMVCKQISSNDSLLLHQKITEKIPKSWEKFSILKTLEQ